MSDKLTQAVLGFRMWPITPNGLGAATNRPGWEPGINTAKCAQPEADTSSVRGMRYFYVDTRLKQPHTAPHRDCHCGLYAWGTLDQLNDYRYDPGMSIYGAVAGWGKVISHKQGWRAEKVRVLAFAVRQDTPFMRAIAQTIADQYKVPLVPYDMLQLQGALHAQPMPEEHIPEPPPRQEYDPSTMALYNLAFNAVWGQPQYGWYSSTTSLQPPAKPSGQYAKFINGHWTLEDDAFDLKKSKPGDLIAELKKKTYRPPESRGAQFKRSK